MSFRCPNCGKGTVEYQDANMSQCTNCLTTVPNAHLRFLDGFMSDQTTLHDAI